VKTIELRISWLALLLLSLMASAAYAQITPLGDAYTNTANPTTKYGSVGLLDVDGASQVTYIQFPLSSIPAGASVSQATLKLFVNSVTTAGSFNVDYVSATWSESTIDASNAPTLGATIVPNVDVTNADKNQYILINVTSAVQAWLDGSETNNGIVLVANNTFSASFDSKENTGTSHPAELDIAYLGGGGTITGLTTASGSGLTGGGASGTLNLGLTTACSAGQVLSWNGSAWGCTAMSAGGTITGVTAGAGLTGGGASGNVTLNLNTAQVPLLAAFNTFTGANTFTNVNNFSATTTNAINANTWSAGNAALNATEFATSGGSNGVYSVTYDPTGYGVWGVNGATSGGAVGVYGTTNDPSGAAVQGFNLNGNAIVGASGSGTAVGGSSATGNAVTGVSGGGSGVSGSSSSGSGVVGYSETGNAMVAQGNASQTRASGGWVKGMVYVNGSVAPYSIVRCFNSTLTGSAATTPPCGFTLTEYMGYPGQWIVDFGFQVNDRFWSATLGAPPFYETTQPSITVDTYYPGADLGLTDSQLYVVVYTQCCGSDEQLYWNYNLIVY
jgi:hypothetical protein